jgi:hypothetical protein
MEKKKDIFYKIPGYTGNLVITCSYCGGIFDIVYTFIGEFPCAYCGRYITITDSPPPCDTEDQDSAATQK